MGPACQWKEAERNATASHAHAASPEADAMALLQIPRLRSAALPCSPNRLPCSALLSPLPPISNPRPPRNSPAITHPHHRTTTTTTTRAMDLFPDGVFVRLESRAKSGKFVHADEDWERVSLRSSNNDAVDPTVWRVQHWVEEGETYVLLQNAAYGRYLSYSTLKEQLAERGARGFRVTQRDRCEPDPVDGVLPRLQTFPWMWSVQRLPRPDHAYVSLRFFTCYLCANDRYFSWNKFVTADVDQAAPRVKTVMQWTVRPVAASRVPPPLPLPPQDQGDDNDPLYPHPARTIRHVQANDEGQFDQNHYNWPSFAYNGSSVVILKHQLGFLQAWKEDTATYTLCVRPGSNGRLMPLVTDLPSSSDPMNIVVLRTGTPAAAALQYPAGADDNAA